jgi:hypothetical protein
VKQLFRQELTLASAWSGTPDRLTLDRNSLFF